MRAREQTLNFKNLRGRMPARRWHAVGSDPYKRPVKRPVDLEVEGNVALHPIPSHPFVALAATFARHRAPSATRRDLCAAARDSALVAIPAKPVR
jgi:hypothetical protein